MSGEGADRRGNSIHEHVVIIGTADPVPGARAGGQQHTVVRVHLPGEVVRGGYNNVNVSGSIYLS